MPSITLRKLSRRTAAAILTAAVLVGATACASSSTSAKSSDSKIDLSGVTLIVGQNNYDLEPKFKASGVLDDIPYKVQFATFSNVADVLTALGSGAVDVSGGSPVGVIQAQASAGVPWTADDLPYRGILFTTTADPANGQAFVQLASKKSGITEFTADAIRGKRWSTPPGGNTQLSQLLALKYLGLTTKDVQIVSLDHAQAAAALAAGEVDVTSAVVGNFGQVIANGDARIIADASVYDGVIPGGTYATTKALADPAKRAAIKDFVKRLIQNDLWWLEHPEKAQKVLVDSQKLSPEAAALSWQYTRNIAEPIDTSLKKSIQSYADVLYEAGNVSKKVDTGITLDDEFTDVINGELDKLDYSARVQATLDNK